MTAGVWMTSQPRGGNTRRRKRGRPKGRKNNPKSTPVLARSNARKIAKIYKQIEYKHADYAASTPIPSTGLVVDVCQPTVGDQDFLQRDGDKIYLTSVIVRGILQQADSPTNNIRMIVFTYNSPSTLVPTVNDILIQPQPVAQATTPFTWLYNLDTLRGGKLKIRYDKTYRVTTQPGGYNQDINIYKKIRLGTTVQFLGGTTKGYKKLYILLISDSAVVAHPTMLYNVRINYSDL